MSPNQTDDRDYSTVSQPNSEILKIESELVRRTISPNRTVPYKVTLNMDDMNTSSIPK